jgi:hypothetical protein
MAQSRPVFVPYQDALEGFTNIRKEMNGYVADGEIDKAKEMFSLLKVYAANEHAVSMDVLAYYYKSGIEKVVPENYNRYLEWELLAAARGNEFAIEKLQFIIGFACEQIMESDDYREIAYKNDINEENALYILGKNICKVIVKKHLHLFPSDLATASDIEEKYSQEDNISFRKLIEKALPDVIAAMK